ncbi:MAG: T9SS type A sorting domain-containing protein [Candidatus Cloacimonetes bacterium]|nr:T9SS type A sorting domain-containing protein [Candidatus Cloacimonadota bacterium]
MKKSYLLFIVLLAPLFLFAEVLEVSHDTSHPYQLIQDAISSAVEGDTILVHPGVYYENISFEGKHGITLISSGCEDNTVIDGINGGRACITLVNGEENILISGFEIRNGGIPSESQDRAGGICLDTVNNISLRNLVIHDNHAIAGAGLRIRGSENISLSNLEIFNNFAYSAAGGIYQLRNKSVIFDMINRCSVYDNFAVQYMDIINYDATSIYLNKFTYPQMEGDNLYLLQIPYGPHTVFHTLPVFDVQIPLREYLDRDVYVSPEGDDNNDGLTPETPFKNLWFALSRLHPTNGNSHTVYLSEGSFTNTAGGVDVGMFIPDNIIIQGAGKEETRIETAIYNYYETVINVKRNAQNVILKDFTLSSLRGSSLVVYDAGYVRFENVAIEDCHDFNQDIIRITGDNTNADFINFTCRNNEDIDNAGGVIHFDGNKLRLQNCLFENNRIQNSGIEISYCHLYAAYKDSVIIKDSMFLNNVHNPTDANMTIYRRGVSDQRTVVIDNCLFANNYCSGPVGFRINADYIHIYNSTFANNRTAGFYNGYITTNSTYSTSMVNCAFFDNTTTTELYPEADSLFIDYCAFDRQFALYLFGDNQMGTHNYTNVDFRVNEGDQNLLDYYLYNETNPITPALSIDHGTMNPADFYPGYVLPEFDVLGNPRIYNDIIDIGAIEYRNPIANDEQVIIPSLNLSCAPNPFNPTTTISFDIPKNSMTELAVYNIRGQRVNTLLNERLKAGTHQVVWNGDDIKGHSVGSGVYFLRLMTNQESKTFKAVMLK